MKFKFNKLIILKIMFMILLICISVAVLIIKGVGLASLVFTIVVILSVIDSAKDVLKIKKFINNSENDYLNIENEINNSSKKFYKFFTTDKYLFMVDDLKKVYYSDIIVAEASPTLLSGTKGSTLGYKYKLYLKNEDKIICKFHLSNNNFERFERILKAKNPKIFFGIYEDYIKNEER